MVHIEKEPIEKGLRTPIIENFRKWGKVYRCIGLVWISH